MDDFNNLENKLSDPPKESLEKISGSIENIH